jgi:hypothetical protein
MWCDHDVPAPEELSRDELIALVKRQDRQIGTMAAQMADLAEANERLSRRLAQPEHLPFSQLG